MGKQHQAIRQGPLEFGNLHQRAMGGQGRQGLLQPLKPLLQGRIHGKSTAESLAQHPRRLEWELPTTPTRQPLTPGPHRPQLSLGDRIKRKLHLNATRGTQPDQTTGRRLRTSRQGTKRQRAPLSTNGRTTAWPDGRAAN